MDERRGKLPRSAYLRALIESALSDDPDQPRIAYRTAAEVMKEKKLKVIPSGRHLHRYTKGEVVRHRKGVPVYSYVCECGLTKEDT